jgi:two-component system alkaline phosphatase synthesis response regulator PhoP
MANELVLIILILPGKNVRYLIEYVLEPNGYRVLVTGDGEEGLELAQNKQPDLVLMDMQLPAMTAMEVLYALNNTQVNIPVIVMTPQSSETLAVQVF